MENVTQCPNCSVKLGCSCKLRTSPKGTRCCTNCIKLVIAQGK
jgi:hypothetical protein